MAAFCAIARPLSQEVGDARGGFAGETRWIGEGAALLPPRASGIVAEGGKSGVEHL
jgi:hypothetical protein